MSALGQSVQTPVLPLCRRKLQFSKRRFGPEAAFSVCPLSARSFDNSDNLCKFQGYGAFRLIAVMAIFDPILQTRHWHSSLHQGSTKKAAVRSMEPPPLPLSLEQVALVNELTFSRP